MEQQNEQLEQETTQRCLEIVENASSEIDILLKSSVETIGRANSINNEFSKMKGILIHKYGAAEAGTQYQPEGRKNFPPITNFMGEPIAGTDLSEENKIDLSKSSTNIYKNPDEMNYKARMYSEMYSGSLRARLITRLRPGVEIKLRKNKGDEFAGEYPGICESIINIHLFLTREEYKSLPISKEAIAKYQDQYPMEFNVLKSVNEWIEDGKSLDQIKKLLVS